MASKTNVLVSLGPAIDALAAAEGFRQRDMMATVVHKTRTVQERAKAQAMLAIQCDPERTFALVRLEAPPRAPWVRRYERLLARAGFRERERFRDELSMDRSIIDNGDLGRELEVLNQILHLEESNRLLPIRKPRPILVRKRRRSEREWSSTLAVMRAALIRWDCCMASFYRQGHLRGDPGVAIEVRPCANEDLGQPANVHLLVTLATNEKSASKPARRAMQALARGGYERSRYSQTYCGFMNFSDPVKAASESQRVFAMLTGPI